jgi:undecaprenyl-diphosphatase
MIFAKLAVFDIRVFYLINHLPHGKFFDWTARIIHCLTYGGIIYYPYLAFFWLAGGNNHRLLARLGFFSGILTFIITDLILKNLTARLRPYKVLAGVICINPAPGGYSFPSGQAGIVFAVATLYFLIFPGNLVGYLLFLFAIAVLLNRVYTGHHYPSEVLVGAAIGCLCSFFVYEYQWIFLNILSLSWRLIG